MQQSNVISLHDRYLLKPNFEPERGHYKYTIYACEGHKILDGDPVASQEQALSKAQKLVALLEKTRNL